MRQTGIIATQGIYALKHNINRLQDDHDNAFAFHEIAVHSKNIYIDKQSIQTNIVLMDVTQTGLSAKYICDELEKSDVKVGYINEHYVRAVFYMGITKEAAQLFSKATCRFFSNDLIFNLGFDYACFVIKITKKGM